MPDSALPPAPLSPPAKVFSFTDFSMYSPSAQPPGDRIDAQQTENLRSINTIIARLMTIQRDDGALQNFIVTMDSLAPELRELLTSPQPIIPPPDIAQAINDANAARDAAQASKEATDLAVQQVANALAQTDGLIARAFAVKQQADQANASATMIAQGFAAAEVTISNTLSSDIKTQASAETAEQYAWWWAEKLDGPVMTEAEYAAIDPALIPPGYQYNPVPGSVGGMWSSHWWAIQAQTAVSNISVSVAAAQAAAAAAAASASSAAGSVTTINASLAQFNQLYLGAKPADPTHDNTGQTLTNGAMYWNTATLQMKVWTFPAWVAVTSGGGGGGITDAPLDGYIYGRKNGAWTQVNLNAVGGIPDAPNDGKQYGRQGGTWTVVLAGIVAWADITGKPATFPPSPHTHTIADVTNLQTTLTTESTTRANNDTALATAISTLKASQVANDSSNAGTKVSDALNALATAVTAKANANNAVLTGDPQAPTPAANDNDTSIATTAWVQTRVASKQDTQAGLTAFVALQPGLASGDMLYATGPNTLVKLAKGTDGQVLTIDPTSHLPLWKDASASGLVAIADKAAPPASPKPGQLWWQSDTGALLVYYQDANSSQWVGITPPVGS